MAPGLEKIENELFYCLNSNLFICYPYGSGIRRKGVSVRGGGMWLSVCPEGFIHAGKTVCPDFVDPLLFPVEPPCADNIVVYFGVYPVPVLGQEYKRFRLRPFPFHDVAGPADNSTLREVYFKRIGKPPVSIPLFVPVVELRQYQVGRIAIGEFYYVNGEVPRIQHGPEYDSFSKSRKVCRGTEKGSGFSCFRTVRTVVEVQLEQLRCFSSGAGKRASASGSGAGGQKKEPGNRNEEMQIKLRHTAIRYHDTRGTQNVVRIYRAAKVIKIARVRLNDRQDFQRDNKLCAKKKADARSSAAYCPLFCPFHYLCP